MRHKPKLQDYLHEAPKCKYCYKQIAGISRYLRHLRHHETNIRPYWYKNPKLKPKSGSKRIWPKRCKIRKILKLKTKRNINNNKAIAFNTESNGEKAGNITCFDDSASKKSRTFIHNEDSASKKTSKSTCNKKIKDILAEQAMCNNGMHKCDYCIQVFNDGMSKRLHELVQHREQFLPLSFIKKRQEEEKKKELFEVKPLEIEEEKIHKCDFCNEAFHTREKKKLHEMTHKGKKPHKCDYCDQTFTFKNRKLRHEIYHTGIKPHKCSYCAKEFIYASDKRHHEAKHRGHKTYKCRFCDQEFDYNSQKVKHEKEHTGGKRYTCLNCGRKFRYPSDVKEHWKNSRRCRPADKGDYSKLTPQVGIGPTENKQATELKCYEEASSPALPTYTNQPAVLLNQASTPAVLLNQASTSFIPYPQPLMLIPDTGTSTPTLKPYTLQQWGLPLRASELLAHIKSLDDTSKGAQTKQAVPSQDAEKIIQVSKNNKVAQEKMARNMCA